MKLRVDDVMPHLVERIPVDLQLTLVHMDIERDVGLVVAHLPSLCDLNSRSITPTVSSPARLRAMARSPTSLSSRGCGTDPRVVRRGPLENRRPRSVHVLFRFGWLWRVRVSLLALKERSHSRTADCQESTDLRIQVVVTPPSRRSIADTAISDTPCLTTVASGNVAFSSAKVLSEIGRPGSRIASSTMTR